MCQKIDSNGTRGYLEKKKKKERDRERLYLNEATWEQSEDR